MGTIEDFVKMRSIDGSIDGSGDGWCCDNDVYVSFDDKFCEDNFEEDDE